MKPRAAAGKTLFGAAGGTLDPPEGGFYHDGRFASLRDVMEHYHRCLNLGLTEQEKISLSEYLKSL